MSTAIALLELGTALLADSSQSARADALLLLAHAIGRRREWIAANPQANVSEGEAQAFRSDCDRRRLGEPIAYIVGSAGFYGREYLVNEHVLIPRPETEHLIDEALSFIKSRRVSPGSEFSILDVGVGSGAIACTVAAETGLNVDGTEISREALAIAVHNAARLDVTDRCRFWHGPLTAPVHARTFDLVIANLPYIPKRNLPRRPDPVSFEPRLALDGGPDGLVHYRGLLDQLPRQLNPGSLVLLECAPPTFSSLQDLVRQHFPHFVIEGCSDYAGLPRYIKAQSPRSRELRAGAAASESARSQGGREG